MRAARRPQVGHQVSLDITAPDDITPLKLTGMVAWIRDGRDPGFGVEAATLAIEAGTPIYQNLNGPQLFRNWQVLTALRISP